MADEMDDPVEHEVDVFLSKSLATNLYVLQYPLRPVHMSYENMQHTGARVKPLQKRVELELSLNTRSSNYAKSKGEQIAVNTDGGNKLTDAEPYFASGMMDKQVLGSIPSAADTGRYAVGVLKNGELHLTPVHAVVQMRPTFDYLDRADAKHKAETAAAAKDAGDSSQDEAEEEATPVTVKFARPESEEAKARRMASYEYVQRRLEEEPWTSVRFQNLHDEQVEPEFQHLFASHGGEKTQQFQSAPADYLKQLMPPAADDKEEKPAMPDNVLSLTQLRNMPLADQVRALLTNVKVMRFSQLMELLPQGTDPQAALRLLQQVAVMVQGCWVVKSEVLYPKETCSAHSGVSSEHLIRGRDFIMWKFTHCKYVVRKEISSGLPSEDVKDILEQMSRLRTSKGWEFVFNYDRDFVERHPDVVQRQRLLWDAKFQSLAKQFKMPKDADKKAKEAELALMNQNIERPRRRRASSKSSPRKRTLSGRSMSDLSDMETDGTADRKDSVDSTSVKVEPMEVCGEPEANNIHPANGPLNNGLPSNGGDMDKGDGGSMKLGKDALLKRELVAFAKETLGKRQVVSLSEVKRLFYLKLSLSPPGHILASGVSDRMLEEAFTSEEWPPKTQPDTTFGLVRQGDKTDKLRKLLFEMFEASYRVRSPTFITRVKESFGVEFSEPECKRVLREVCESHGAMWYLKGTIPSHS
ncbi:hypothetical protein BaRGS_00033340 [Batillaria attramentaria]|uniref:DNA-directed RNA polymerase III subunit RPC5 C-terminal domain-containing protein n=1 Tax=Batillaria attramentaria TaxID=370345 RepID=A0ABD0JL40_9CAEN